MTAPASPNASGSPGAPASLDAALRRAHRSALISLALCAVFCVLQEWPADEPPPDRSTTVVAVSLALTTIVLRRLNSSPVMGVRTRVGVLMASYAAAVALGLTGAFIANSQAAVQTGLVFCVAAAIFCLRPPPTMAPPGSAEGRA